MNNQQSDTLKLTIKTPINDNAIVDISVQHDAIEVSDSKVDEAELLVVREFVRLSDTWTSTAIGFFETVPLLSYAGLAMANRELAESVVEYADHIALERFEKVEEDTCVQEFVIAVEELPVISKLMNQATHVLRGARAMSSATLGALISEYEAFLIQMFKAISDIQPQVFLSGKDTVAIEDIERFSDYEDLKAELIDKKISSLLQEKSQVQMLHWIGEKLSCNLTSDIELIKEFTEICQRRHLLVHNGGKVNEKYQRHCLDVGWEMKDLPPIGSQVDVDRKYLRRATARVFQVGFFTLHIIWQKIISESREKSLGRLLETSHDFLECDLTKMSRRVCEFALFNSSRMKVETKQYFAINLAQAYLFDCSFADQERDNAVEGVLKKYDWSATSPVTDLALACLRRDYSNLSFLTENAIGKGLRKSQAQTWNIFREVRERPEFIGMFENQ